MTTHTLENNAEGNTAEAVQWKCTVCQTIINFAREGFGEPVGSETEFPENVDAYMGECSGEPTYEWISKQEFIGRFTDAELGAILAAKETDNAVKIMFYRFENCDEIPIDHPQTLAGLEYLESISALTVGRSTEIIAAE